MKLSLLAFTVMLCLWLVLPAAAQTQSLDGPWQFAVDREGRWTVSDLSTIRDWREIRVPLSWNAQFADLRDYRGVAWYRKQISVPSLKPDQTALLRFGAVDYLAEVFVNGRPAGRHEGGYLPFAIDIGGFVKAGDNEIAVRVTDPDNDKARWGDMIFDEIPHGKQSWYVHTGGIWQSVALEVRPKLHIAKVHVTARINGELEVSVIYNDPSQTPKQTSVRIIAPDRKAISLGSGKDLGGIHGFTGKVSDPKLWGIDQPNLYTAEVRLGGDTLTTRFGFRSFEARDGKFYLNGEPIYIVSALDQDFYPDGIYTPPSYAFLVDQMKKAREMGLNMLRTHIKIPTPDYLRAADEAGLLIWYEVPSWDDNTWTPAAAARGERTFLDMLDRDWNHPSIVVMSIINEAWGVNGLKEEHTRKWLKEAFARLKPIAARAGKLVVDNSPCCQNFHLQTDIADFHQYYSIPDRSRDWDKWVADLGSRPAWLWSKHGDAAPTGREPIVLSEFGNWGLPELPQQLPWWFDRDFGGREITRPAGVFDRFHGFKFDRLFTGFNDLARATQRHQWISLKHEIETIRAESAIEGYTITEFTDLNWECNGLLDIYRNKKIYAADLSRLQAPDVIFARLNKHNYAGGDEIELPLYVSRYGAAASEALTATLTLDGKKIGQIDVTAASRGSVAKLPALKFATPKVETAQAIRVHLELRDRNNRVIAGNYAEIFVYPPRRRESDAIALAAGLTRLTEPLRAAGYQIAATPAADTLLVTDRLDAATEAHLKSGGRAVVLANDKDALPPDGKLKMTSRRGPGSLDGNWVTNFNWVNVNSAPFKAVAFDKLLGFESIEVAPEFVIKGIDGAEYTDVYAGIFYGWVNQNAALAVGAQHGAGRLLITTLRLSDAYGSDEYATRLLDEMIRHTRGDGFAPRLQY